MGQRWDVRVEAAWSPGPVNGSRRPLASLRPLAALLLALVISVAVGCSLDQPPTSTTSTSTGTSTSSSTSTTDPTDPGDTTTTSDPDDTTTTTIDPTDPGDDPDDGPEFAFDEPSVMFTEGGGSVDIKLGEYDEGELTDTDVPDEVTYEVIGDQDAFHVDDLGDGGLRITSDGTVGGIVIAARVPGQALATVTEIYTAEPNPDVQVFDTDRVVFPPANLPSGMNIKDYRDAAGLVTSSSVGPFTRQELADQVFIPEDTDTEVDDVPEPDVDPGATEFPFVIRGAAPAIGTKVLSGGKSGMAGEVIASTTRPFGGEFYSMITVRTGSLLDIYARVRWNPEGVDQDMTEQELLDHESPLVRAGVVPESYGFDVSCADPATPVDECDDLVDTPFMTVIGADGTPTQFGRSARPSTAATRAQRSVSAAASSSTQAKAAPFGIECAPAVSSSIFGLKGPDPKVSISPKFTFTTNIGEVDPSDEFIYMAGGYMMTSSYGLSGKIMASLSAGAECLKTLGFVGVPVPMGPGTGLLDFGVQTSAMASFGIGVEGGPSLEFGFQCSTLHNYRLGYRATTLPGGGRLENVERIRLDLKDRDCTPKWDPKLGVNSEGVAAKVEASAMLGLKFSLGFKVGGFLSSTIWAEWLNFPNQGFFDFVNLVVGPRVVMSTETTARVLDNSASDSRVAIEMYAKGEIGSAALERMAQGIGISPLAVKHAIGVTLFEGALPIVSLYEPINAVPGSMQVSVDGETQNGVAKVREGQRLRIRSLMAAAGDSINQEVRDAELYLVKGFGIYKKFDGVKLSTGTGMDIDDDFVVSKSLCETIGTDAIDVVMIAQSIVARPGGVELDAPSYGGTFKIRCLKPELKFSAESVDFASDEVGTSKSIDLTATMLAGKPWTITDKPSWLAISPMTATPPADTDESTMGLGVNVICPTGESKKYNGTVTASADAAGTVGTVTASFKVSGDCRKVYIDATPKSFTVSYEGGTLDVTLTSDGPHPVLVGKAPGHGPDGLLFLSGKTTKTLTITVDPLSPSCNPQGRTLTYDYTSWPVVEEAIYGRGDFSIVVKQGAPPRKPADECDPPAGSSGDPHMVTFGGQTYDAQTLGEYWYVKPGANGPDMKVQVRNELYNAKTTIVTAAAVEINGHKVELYRRSELAPQTKVLIDGEYRGLAFGDFVDLGDGVTLSTSRGWSPGSTRTETIWTIRAPGFMMTAQDNRSPLAEADELVIRLWVDRGTDIGGVLGSPDGDPSNDLRTSDGQSTYSLGSIRLHGSALLDFWGSWRVTDLADSLFSQTYDGFDQTISLFSPIDLAAKRQLAEDYMANFDVICEMPTGDEYAYAMDRLAVELVAGSPQSMLDDATCGYMIRGRVTTSLPGNQIVPVPGLDLTLSGDRLRDCNATTDNNGNYSCRLVPLPGEELPDTGTAPVDVSMNGSWKSGGPVIVTENATFDQFARLGGHDVSIDKDISVDRSELVAAHVTGTLTADLNGNGLAPVTSPTQVVLKAFDGDGELLGTFIDWVSPDGEGGYSYSKYLPGHAETVEVLYRIGSRVDDWPTLTFAVQTGTNSLDGDLAFNPPLALVSGTLVDADGDPLGRTTIEVVTTRLGVPVSATQRDVYPAVDGSYSSTLQLPTTPLDSITARAHVGVTQQDWVSVTTSPVVPGANPVDLSAVYDPPVLDLSGTLTGRDGGPLASSRAFVPYTVTAFDDSDEIIYSKTLNAAYDATTGQYTGRADMPLATAHALVKLQVGVTQADWPQIPVPDVVIGHNDVVFDYTYAPQRLRLSGVLLDGEGHGRPKTNMTISTYDADNQLLATVHASGTPDENTGAYDTGEIVLPLGSRRAVAVYQLGVGPADHQSFEITSLDADLTERVIDIDQRYVKLMVEGLATTSHEIGLQPLYIRTKAYGANGQLLQNGAYPVEPRPDGGWYGFTAQVPDLTTRVVLTAEVQGAFAIDYPTMEVTDLVPGLNQVLFDFTHVPTIVHVSGTMYGVPPATGVPGRLAVTSTLGFTARDSDGIVLHKNGSSPLFNLDSVTGAYYTDIVVPNDTASVTLNSWFNAGLPGRNDSATKVVDGVTSGTTTNVVFDDDYSPPVLKLHGTVVIGGEPYVGNLRIGGYTTDVDGNRSNLPFGSLVATTNSAGEFERSLTLFRDAVSANITLTPTVGSSPTTTLALDDLSAGWNDVPVSIDIDDFKVSMWGNLVLFDQVQTSPYPAILHSFDGDGNEIEARAVTLDPTNDPDDEPGHFQSTFDLSSATRSVSVTFEYTDPDTGVTVPFEFGPRPVSKGVANDFGMLFPIEGSFVSSSIEFTHGGDPYVGPVHVTATYQYGDDLYSTGVSDEYDVTTDATGAVDVTTFIGWLEDSGRLLKAVAFEFTDDDGHVLTRSVATDRTKEVTHEACDWNYDEDLEEWVCEPYEYTETEALPSVYVDNATLDFTTVVRDVVVKAPVIGDVDFGFYRLPYSHVVNPGELDHGFNALGGYPAVGTWDPVAGGVRYTVTMSPLATHLAVTAHGAGGASDVLVHQIVAMPAEGDIVVEPSTGPIRLNLSGRSSSADAPACGYWGPEDIDFAGISRAKVMLGNGTPPPDKPTDRNDPDYWNDLSAWMDWQGDPANWTTVVDAWVIIDEDGNYTLPVDLDTSGYDWLVVELSNDGYYDRGWSGSVNDNTERLTVGLSEHVGQPTIDVTLDNRPGCSYPV